MKTKLVPVFLVFVLLLIAVAPTVALAGAYEQSYITSITYQNVDTSATTNLRFFFYDSPLDTTPVEIICGPAPAPCNNLNPGAGSSLYIGGLGAIGAGFRGTAVLASDKRMIATLVQIPQTATDSPIKNRPLSNGFSSGTANSLLATVTKNAFTQQQYTILSVQNAGTSQTSVAIKFYDTSATLKHTINTTLQPGAGYIVDTGSISQLDTTFNGSAVIESTGGSIVSSAMELYSNGTGSDAFEGVGTGSLKFYMPSALCNYSALVQNTYYAVQNTNLTQSTNVTVTYSGGASQTKPIGPGAKASFTTCEAGVGAGFIGSAVVESNTTNIIAVGKVAGGGLSTAFVGFSSGASKLAMPYVRYGNGTNYNSGLVPRTYIAIQNVGTSTITGDIVVKYIDRTGATVGTHTITADVPVGGKVNSNATNAGLSEFGYYGSGQFGGGVIVEGPAGSQLVSVARVVFLAPGGATVGEDYGGVVVP